MDLLACIQQLTLYDLIGIYGSGNRIVQLFIMYCSVETETAETAELKAKSQLARLFEVPYVGEFLKLYMH